ncbi:MAG: hypothetical protein ACOCYU_02705 [Brevefilum sp.]
MKKSKLSLLLPIIGGTLLIAAGVIFLLNNLGLLNIDWEMVIGPIFALGGLVFLVVFIMDTDNWWALIPGFVLIAIGVIIFMDQNFESIAEIWSGAVFLGLIGLAFLLIYVFHTDNWWAIIPGGVLLTLAGVTLVPGDGVMGGVIFFIGLAITFDLVYLLPNPSGRLTWALYPAGILLLIGILVLLGAKNLMDYVWPVALLIAGGFILIRALKK